MARFVAAIAVACLLTRVACAEQETAETAPAPTLPECPYDGVTCAEVAAAQLLGLIGAPFRPEEGLLLPADLYDPRGDGRALEALGAALAPFGVTAERLTLPPRALRELEMPAIVRVRLPNGHPHFEVHTSGSRTHGRFLDLDFSTTGAPTLRAYATLGDGWDGSALVVHRRPDFLADNAVLLIGLAALGLLAGWVIAMRIQRGRRA